ncbi:MAG: DUF998 domain-containing protein [Clostridia bacterium]|nr:DUF998 domain-containing protein [Clostridia bacterium]
MTKKSLLNWLCLSGILSIIFYLLHDVVGAMNYPGYNWMSQAVSDLTATNAPSYMIATGYITAYKILNLMCVGLVSILMETDKNKMLKIGIYIFTLMSFISAIGYTLFPLSSSGYDGSVQSFIHVYILTALVVILSIVSLTMIAIGSLRGNDKHKVLGILAIVSLAIMFIGAIGGNIAPKEVFGIFERFSTYSAVVYAGVLGIVGFKVED